MNFIHCAGYLKASRQAANLISAQIILNPGTVLGLATGSTPLGVYAQLANWYEKGDLDFSQATSFNLDEYVGLAPGHPQSYAHYMREHFFSKVNFRPDRCFLPYGLAEDMEEACIAYDRRIEQAGGIDFQLLGIGRNGHIGFNEPGNSFAKGTHIVTLQPSTRNANARFFSSANEVPAHAVTMGMKTIMQARRILLMACGTEKREILENSLYGPVSPDIPASILQLHPDLTVIYCDESAQ